MAKQPKALAIWQFIGDYRPQLTRLVTPERVRVWIDEVSDLPTMTEKIRHITEAYQAILRELEHRQSEQSNK